MQHHLPQGITRRTVPPASRSDHPFRRNSNRIGSMTFQSTSFFATQDGALSASLSSTGGASGLYVQFIYMSVVESKAINTCVCGFQRVESFLTQTAHPGSIPGRCTWHRRSPAAWNSVRVPVSTWSTADMVLSPQPTNLKRPCIKPILTANTFIVVYKSWSFTLTLSCTKLKICLIYPFLFHLS